MKTHNDLLDANHPSGIIAAQPGNPYNLTGVAYKSTINA